MNDQSSENVNERSHPWKIRMYRVHSGSSIYEERSVASMDDAAPGTNTPRSAFNTPNAAVSRTETAEARRPSRYRPNQEARRGTREHCSEIGIYPTRSESYNLMSGRRRGRSSEDPTGRDFGFDRPQQQCSICRGVPLWCLRPPSLYWLPPRWKSQNKSKVLMKPLSIPGISLKGHGAHFLDKCNSLVESILFTIHLNRYVQFGFWNISRDSCQFHVKSSSILFEWSLHEN